jgi:hypothetical protein
VGVVVLLALIFQALVCGAGGRGGIRGKRKEFLEKRCDVGRRLGGGFVAIRACFDFGQNCVRLVGRKYHICSNAHTLQPINGPLLELFEGDFSSRRCIIDVHAMGIVLLLECCSGKLPFLVINDSPPFRINAVNILSHHDGGCVFDSMNSRDLVTD